MVSRSSEVVMKAIVIWTKIAILFGVGRVTDFVDVVSIDSLIVEWGWYHIVSDLVGFGNTWTNQWGCHYEVKSWETFEKRK